MLLPVYHKELFGRRRQNLLQLIKEEYPFLIILFNAPVYPKGSDAFYSYRADSSFYYMTGLVADESAALIWKSDKKINYELFVRPKDPVKELWDGYLPGPEGIQSTYKADQTLPNTELGKRIGDWFESLPKGSLPRIYSNFTSHAPNNKKLHSLIHNFQENIRAGVPEPKGFIEILPYIRELRGVKDESEIQTMRDAAAINVRAHLDLMKRVKPGMTEYEAQSIVEAHFLREGARGPGYGSIIGSGDNATTLHYHGNNCTMKKGDLVLVDAGCEYKMYQSDITRTLPVSDTYSPAQKKIMDIVLEAQNIAIDLCVVGRTLAEFHKQTSLALIEGLKTLKLLKGSSEKIYESGEHRRYYPHGTGHWLGLDVHDPCPSFENGESIAFKEGMIVTVEPGLYFSPHDKKTPKEYLGIGVRIEDNVVISGKGKKCEILTEELPKSWQEIEKVRKLARKP